MTREQLEARLGRLDAAMLRRLISSGVLEPTDTENTYQVADLRQVDDFASLNSRGMP